MPAKILKPWTPDQVDWLKKHYKYNKLDFLAHRLKRAEKAVEDKLIEMDLLGHDPEDTAPAIAMLSQIIPPPPEKTEWYLRGKIAENVIYGLT